MPTRRQDDAYQSPCRGAPGYTYTPGPPAACNLLLLSISFSSLRTKLYQTEHNHFSKIANLRIARSDVYFGLSGGNPITNGRLPGTLPPAIPCIPPAQEYRNVRTASTHRGRHFCPAYIRNEKVPVIPGASPVLLRR